MYVFMNSEWPGKNRGATRREVRSLIARVSEWVSLSETREAISLNRKKIYSINTNNNEKGE